MKLLSAIEILLPLMVLVFVIGLALCVVSLARAVRGRRKIPYVSVSCLLTPIAFFVLSKTVVVEILENLIASEEVQVTVSPAMDGDPRQVFQKAMANIYSFKGLSGSHPTNKKYVFEVCSVANCSVTIIAEDSRDSGMYWMSQEILGVGSIPLGYTRLAGAKI